MKRHHAVVVALTAACALSVTGCSETPVNHTIAHYPPMKGAGGIILAATPVKTIIGANNMGPGDVLYDRLTVTNPDSSQQRYTVTQSATDPDGVNLAAELNFGVVTIAHDEACDQTAFAGTPALLTAKGQKFADATVFKDRVLDADTSETLCFQVILPSNATPNYVGSSTVGNLTFAKE